MIGRLSLIPISISSAIKFSRERHRHHSKCQGGLFAVACGFDGKVSAVAIVGRPVSRMIDDGFTCEVTRLCSDGTDNACSMLYGASWRAAKSLGYKRIVTYTMEGEDGTSLMASGWVCTAKTSGGSWDRPSRHRDTDQILIFPKYRWENGTEKKIGIKRERLILGQKVD